MDINPINPIKILVHSERIKQCINGEMPNPITISLNISNVCNCDCIWCIYDGYRINNPFIMEKDLIFKVIKDVKDAGAKFCCFSGGGEPTVNQHLNDAILFCSKVGLGCALITNGINIDKLTNEAISKLKYLRISLDAGNDNTYYLLHRPQRKCFGHILNNIDRICKRKLTKVGVAFLVHPKNCEEIFYLAEYLDEIRCDYLQVRPIKNIHLSSDDYKIMLEQISKIKKQLFIKIYESFSKMDDSINKRIYYSKCYMNKLVSNIGPDGSVYICTELQGREIIGNIKDDSFYNIWFSQKHKKMIDELDIVHCPVCKFAKANEIIERVFVNDEIDRDVL